MPSLVGSFLIADRALNASKFRQTVVLILQHRKDGAFGLVVNRPRPVEGDAQQVFSGGPCTANGLLMLHGHADWNPPHLDVRQVAPGIFVGDFTAIKRATEAADPTAFQFRLFNGYACWNRGQLESELKAGLWTLAPATADILFTTPPEELWPLLGPPRLPRPSRN